MGDSTGVIGAASTTSAGGALSNRATGSAADATTATGSAARAGGSIFSAFSGVGNGTTRPVRAPERGPAVTAGELATFRALRR
jgi:hypothetical protein